MSIPVAILIGVLLGGVVIGMAGYFLFVRNKAEPASLSTDKAAQVAVLEDDTKEAQAQMARNNEKFDQLEQDLKNGIHSDPSVVKLRVENMTSEQVDAELKKRGLL